MYVNAATTAILLAFHLSVPLRSPSEGRLEHIDKKDILTRVHPRRAATTVAGSSKRVLTRFTRGLLRAPTEKRPHDSLGIYLNVPKPVKSGVFSSALVGAEQRRRGGSYENSPPRQLCRWIQILISDIAIPARKE